MPYYKLEYLTRTTSGKIGFPNLGMRQAKRYSKFPTAYRLTPRACSMVGFWADKPG